MSPAPTPPGSSSQETGLQDTSDDNFLAIYIASSIQQSPSQIASTCTGTPSPPTIAYSSLRSSQSAISAFNYLGERARIARKCYQKEHNLKPEWWPAYQLLDDHLEEKLAENHELADDVNTWKMLWMAGKLDKQVSDLLPHDKVIDFNNECNSYTNPSLAAGQPFLRRTPAILSRNRPFPI